MWGSTGSLSCSSASGSLRRSCFSSKDGDEEALGGASGLLRTRLPLTNKGQEQALPRTAPEPHGMTSLHGGQVGFSGGVDGVWWAVGDEGLYPGQERRDPAGRTNPGKQDGTPGVE